jgi:histidine ammonia-lyase
MTAALKLKRILTNATNVLAIEAIAAAQALDFLAPLKTSARGQKAVAVIRSVSAPVEQDRALASDFARVAELIAAGKLADVLN